jgi:hypothetical protein
MKDIEIKSAFYTAVVCLVIFLVMLFYKLTIEPKESVKFNEVIFAQSFEEIKQDESPAQLKAGRGLKTSIAIKTTNLPRINLPTRFTISGEGIIPSEKFAEKISDIEKPGEIAGTGTGHKGFFENASLGKEIKPELGSSERGKTGIGEIKRDFGTGLKQSLSYRIEWEGKINRTKLKGELPKFPEGVNETAVVRFRVVVLPDGSIERIFPIEKSNPEFERSAFEALMTWKFNPIDQQFKQNGIVTFIFTVK